MSTKITCISILRVNDIERLTYTYSVLDESGIVIQSNCKKSYNVEDAETLTIIEQLKLKVNTNLQATL